ncbi:MAG: DEAD/DEAH box helicase, partial [Actinobacteria bacterium]|nr:DEAD/DEAH box helicase [Actinomycetota bacterium]
TNYAMLEYLLLRPDDSPFFDGELARHWKFLILDEAHIYNGASGIEMGMLIRRLKDRVCEGKSGVLRCIATSATLAKEEDDFEKVIRFASNLFGEKFEWDPAQEDRQDVIKGESIKTPTLQESIDLPLGLYSEIDEIITSVQDNSAIIKRCYEICQKAGIVESLLVQAKMQSDDNAKKFLYGILQKDKRTLELKRILETGSIKLEDCIKKVLGNGKPSSKESQAVISLINLAVWVRPEQELLPLLPARYHLFVRAPEGIFVSLFPKPKISLERREQTQVGYPVFELASCRRCGQAYLVSNIINGKLKHFIAEIDAPKENRYFLLTEKKPLFEDDEDEESAEPEKIAEKGKKWRLCVRCGAIWEEYEESSCQCPNKDSEVRNLTEIIPKDGVLNKCYLCGLSSRNIVREFVFQKDAPAAVLITSLFQTLKEKKQKERKILAFSDSRQDAAFFAPYLNSTYETILYRRLIMEVLQQNKSVGDYRLQSLCEDVLKLAEENSLFDQTLDEKQRKRKVWGWILQEFCALAWERNICLEGVGLLYFLPISPEGWEPINDLLQAPWNLSKEESIALYQILLNTIRLKMAVTFPSDGPSPKDEIFAPRNWIYKFSGWKSNSKKGIYSWNPASGRANARLEFLYKLFEKLTGSNDDKGECKKILAKIWEDLSKHWTGENKQIRPLKDSKFGIL